MRGKELESPPLNANIKLRLSAIWRLVDQAVESFRKAQPIAYLTTARMTRATLELAQIFTEGHGRSNVEESLRTLFGDPALSVSLALRTFAAAIITVSFLPPFCDL